MRWCFWRTPPREQEVLHGISRWEAEMVRAGWRMWRYEPPRASSDEIVEVKRRGWPMISIWRVADVGPEVNVAGLWWKPASGPVAEAGEIIIELTKTPLGYVLPPHQ